MSEAKEKRGGTTLDVIDKLDEAKAAVVKKLATIADAPLVAKCEAMLIGFDELRGDLRKLAPDVEQLKGVTKGLQLACPIVQQHVQILKQKYTDPAEGDLLKQGRDVVLGCAGSVEGAWRQQREEMVRMMGRFDGGVNSALAIVRKIEGWVTNYERLLEEEKELAADPFADEPEQLAGGNGVRAKPAPKKKAARKKRAAKKRVPKKAATSGQPN